MYLLQGTVLNKRYQIESVLGHGGFGVTYLARDLTLNVQVAVKEYLPRQLATRAEGATGISIYTGEAREQFEYGLKKFLDEARAVAQFSDHPNIVSARDYFEVNGTAYMVMRYVQGVDFKTYLAQQGGKIPFDMALRIMMPVMDALRKVHAAGLLHRDISPDNIYLTADGQVKLMDFGAARQQTGEHSKSLSVILKTGYAPPEQYRSKGKQGPWTDIYAAAATLYKAITGETPPEALDRLAEDTLTPPSRLGVSIPLPAERALLQALAVNADQRFQSIEEFQQVLTSGPASTVHFQSGPEPSSALVSASPSHHPQLPRRSANPAAIAAGIGAGVLALVLLVVLVWRMVGGPPPVSMVKPPAGDQGPAMTTAPAPVRAPQPGKTRFTKAENGVISDSKTGLEWYVGPDRDTTWNEAKYWTESLTAAGGGWRLPSVPEMKTLYQPGASSNNKDPIFQITGYWVWSGQFKDASSVWRFDFVIGQELPFGPDRAGDARAFAVRSRPRSEVRGPEEVVQNPDIPKPVPAVVQPPVTPQPPPKPVVLTASPEFPRKWRVEWRGGRTKALYMGLLLINNKINDKTYTGSLVVKTPQGYEVSQDAKVYLDQSKVEIKCSNSNVPRYPSDNFYLNLSGNTMKGYDKDVKGNIGLGVTFTKIN